MAPEPGTPSAGQKLGMVGELIERILMELPMKSLLVHAPLVCRKWHLTIQSSTKLQQKLFFVPVYEPKMRIGSIQKRYLPSIDNLPIGKNMDPSVSAYAYFHEHYLDENLLDEDELSYFTRVARQITPYANDACLVEVNPFATPCHSWDREDEDNLSYRVRMTCDWHGIKIRHCQNKDASWRRMLPFRPLILGGIIHCGPRLDHWSNNPSSELEDTLITCADRFKVPFAPEATLGVMMDQQKSILTTMGIDLERFRGIRFQGEHMITNNRVSEHTWNRMCQARVNAMAFKVHYKQLMSTPRGARLAEGSITLDQFLEELHEELSLQKLATLKALFVEDDPDEQQGVSCIESSEWP
ncbi:hypothetical protein AMS68_007914 [Peltaster fructicola]|uniref:F-box domain-containing protein n=1 Tax=Peltaster fructicola TaxID=286661 RepID=A0A6H0Y5S0_9PEZI|nr:hypothetical protein AMS68_007914 [Peltaster fructicola]